MKQHRWYTPWLLVAIPVIWTLVFGIWPFINTIILSFTDARPLTGGSFIGLDNYRALAEDDLFRHALVTTSLYVVACVPLLTLIPLFIAMLLEKRVPGIGFFRTTAYFPVIASVVVVALIWTWLFDSRGLVNGALQWMGVTDQPIAFLVDRWALLACAIGLTVWKGLGFYMVVYLAALGNVGPELHEAAALDGANAFQRFRHVTLPGVRGAVVLVAALIAVAAMRIFSELYILSDHTGGPGGENMSIVMLVRQVGSGLNGQLGYASAISVVLFFLTIGPLAFIGWLNNRDNRPARSAA